MSEFSFSRRQVAGLAAGVGAGAMAALHPQSASAQQPPDLPWFDIRDYGAVGDGVTDDTTAIQDAIDAAGQSQHGGIVLAPPGDYLISNSINAGVTNVDLIGSGKQQTKFVCSSPAAGLRFGNLGAGIAGQASRSGGFWVDGNETAFIPMNIGRSNNRVFYDIGISNGLVGLLVEGTQNAIFEKIVIQQCVAEGLVLDYGAGGNLFLNAQLWGNPTNVMFRNSSPDSGYPYQGRPTDNTFVGGIFEGVGTTVDCDHAAGLMNYFIGTLFAGSNTKVRYRHQDPTTAAGLQGSYHLHLVGCGLVGAGGTGIEHSATFSSIYITACRLWTLDVGFHMADDCWIELDAYNGGGVSTRFSNMPGGAQSEEQLIRRDTCHPHHVTAPANESIAFQTWVGTGLRGDRAPHPSYQVQTSGQMAWGPSDSAPDVSLGRAAPRQLSVDGALVAQDGLGVGNSESASTPGSVVRRMQIFDENGNSLGYIPIYDSIT